jgi:hypothetical protein
MLASNLSRNPFNRPAGTGLFSSCLQARSAWLPGLEFGHFREASPGDRQGGIQKINEAKQLGGMTHHVNGGRRQVRSRAQGSIGVPPVFPIRVQDDDQKLAGLTSPRSHSPICSQHSATQARRLCYHRLGVMPPLLAFLKKHGAHFDEKYLWD